MATGFLACLVASSATGDGADGLLARESKLLKAEITEVGMLEYLLGASVIWLSPDFVRERWPEHGYPWVDFVGEVCGNVSLGNISLEEVDLGDLYIFKDEERGDRTLEGARIEYGDETEVTVHKLCSDIEDSNLQSYGDSFVLLDQAETEPENFWFVTKRQIPSLVMSSDDSIRLNVQKW